MSTKGFEGIIAIGEYMRETGKIDSALTYFRQLLRTSSYREQKVEVMRQIGLCHQHNGNFEEAKNLYIMACDLSVLCKDIAGEARAKRHLVDIELHNGNVVKALALGLEAYQLMNSLHEAPVDFVWVTHGYIKALIASHKGKNEIRDWTIIEFRQLKSMWYVDKNPLHRNVWLTGWIFDVCIAWGPWSWPLGVFGFCIAFYSGLRIRLHQVRKFIR
jgi:hypothetical protein